MPNLIQGKVARILNVRELVLNVGRNSGVQVGTVFDILDSKGENILDPDTGEALGSLSRVKVQVRVTSVQERIAVAETFHKSEVKIGGLGAMSSYRSTVGALAQLFMEPTTLTRYETLKSTGKEHDSLDEKDSFVKIGDVAVQRHIESADLTGGSMEGSES